MISALDVYLVMQADALHSMFVGAMVFSLLSLAITSLIYLIASARGDDVSSATAGRFIKPAALAVSVTVLLVTLVPDSRTSAAMIILPALTKSEVMTPIGDEAKELYGLTKEALRDLVEEGKRTDDRDPD